MEFTERAVKAGSDAKNDVLVTLELGGEGRELEIVSKVARKYGEAIRADVNSVLDEYAVRNVHVLVEDLGTFDFAIKARVETALRRAYANAGLTLPEGRTVRAAKTPGAHKSDLYRTMFFVPGNSPSKLAKAEIYGADCVIFDLEDAVSVYEKDAARDLISRYLEEFDPECRVGIRINAQDTPYYEEDVRRMTPLQPDFLRLAKSETADNIKKLDEDMALCEIKAGIPAGSVKIVATIETALGVYNAYQIASASSRLFAVGLGAEDFRTSMRMSRTEDGEEILFARNLISLAAHAAGKRPLDYVYSNFKNSEGFKADVAKGKMLGFMGKSVIHPSQIPLVHECFTPSDKEIENAREIVSVYEEALAQASGVIQLKGKMIDMPIVLRAQSVLEYARAAGKEF